MSVKYASGTILLRENTLLPAGLAVESETFLTGWRIVRNLDGYGLGRSIEKAHWTFFCLASEVGATVLGRNRPETFLRAVKHVLAKREGKRFNSLEITQVIPKRFLGIPFLNVTARSRHVQESNRLAPVRDQVLSEPVRSAPRTEPQNGEPGHDAKALTKPHAALISSS